VFLVSRYVGLVVFCWLAGVQNTGKVGAVGVDVVVCQADTFVFAGVAVLDANSEALENTLVGVLVGLFCNQSIALAVAILHNL
jgi:hypothetical protein